MLVPSLKRSEQLGNLVNRRQLALAVADFVP
jgi:hypothetical protein